VKADEFVRLIYDFIIMKSAYNRVFYIWIRVLASLLSYMLCYGYAKASEGVFSQ
jgi:hypothetical protein